MAVTYLNQTYSSQKHPVLEYIFNKYYTPGTQEIVFTLEDISEGYAHCRQTDPTSNIKEPASISNTILDLTRKASGISSRLPSSIYNLGFDLCKKTGKHPITGKSLAGAFVYVGVGNTYNTWLVWPTNPRQVIIDPRNIPAPVQAFLRCDEGALFSVIDYCNILSQAFPQFGPIMRVQNPMKWQPNEIDGFYINHTGLHIFPIEAKALTTKDDINLIQLAGGIMTVISKFPAHSAITINPIAAQMVPNGILLGMFTPVNTSCSNYTPVLIDSVFISFTPQLNAWS